MSAETMKAGRNELCPCGSGKKFKRCCGAIDHEGEDTASRFFGIAAVLAAIMAVGGFFVFTRAFFVEQPAKKVWSAEHGHFHTVGGGDHAEGGAGKVWNEEHGHYHDAARPAPPTSGATPVIGALEGLRSAELDEAGKKASGPGH